MNKKEVGDGLTKYLKEQILTWKPSTVNLDKDFQRYYGLIESLRPDYISEGCYDNLYSELLNKYKELLANSIKMGDVRMRNTWGLNFVKVDTEKDEFKSLLALNLGSEEKTKEIFNKIKSEFKENENDQPDCVIDMLDENDDIIDDYALTFSQTQLVASLLGHQI